MKRRLHISISFFTVLLLFVAANAGARSDGRDGSRDNPRFKIAAPRAHGLDANLEATDFHRAAAQGTTWLATYTFDSGPNCVNDGWTSVDLSEQRGDYWHVDDFLWLDGGDSGRLVALEGDQSMWCGARPAGSDNNPNTKKKFRDEPLRAAALCGYATLPGYGNHWNQSLRSADCLTPTGTVHIQFAAMWDSEPDYDATVLEIDACDDDWVQVYGGIGVWDGAGTDTLSIAVTDTIHGGSLRFRFRFVSDDVWSDQDGKWNTDGAFIVDELGVTDAAGILVATEDFEDEAAGDTRADDWVTRKTPGFGDYAALYPGLQILQEDPCAVELDCLWTFFSGSTVTYACGGYPAQLSVPYENARGQYIINEVWSPRIPVAGTGALWELSFDVYRDLPLNALVFYAWKVRFIDATGCPGPWGNDGWVHNGAGKDWIRDTYGFGYLVEPGAVALQVGLGVVDMMWRWGGVYGDGTCHTHAPLFDDVAVYRVGTDGPQWHVEDADQFQDNFSADGTITGTARADMARDILPRDSAAILPGDSAAVTVADPEFGLALDPATQRAAVYCYVSVDGPHGAAPLSALVDDPRYPVADSVTAGGRTWAQILCDTTVAADGEIVEGRYNVDLNDNLFVPGDTVWFFYGAENANSKSTYFALPVPTTTGQTDDVDLAAANADEFSILPAVGDGWIEDILYVDGMNFLGAQPYFDTAFMMLGIYDGVDRYDIRGPSSAVGNHPGSRVIDVTGQLLAVYRNIIWNTGDLQTAFGDGSGWPDKSDDTGMLLAFLDGLENYGGVYLNGDDVAEEWNGSFTSASAVQLRAQYMNFNILSGDHLDFGLSINPLGVGVPGGIFSDYSGEDTLVVYGGCPLINDFDVLDPAGISVAEMWYGGSHTGAAAVVGQTTTNPELADVGFVLSGFSYHYIRDAFPSPVPARAEHLLHILYYLGNVMPMPTGVKTVAAYDNALEQNRPNPFNPTTTIEYSIRERAHVSLRVYNVAGQLVRTLVDEVQSPESVAPARWDGRDDGGRAVASGVYFYKLATKNFVKTKKMVLLK